MWFWLLAGVPIAAIAIGTLIGLASRRRSSVRRGARSQTKGGNTSRSDGWELFSRLLRNRIVFVSGHIDDDSAQVTIAQLLYLEDQDRHAPILLYVNSPGGHVTAAFAILDTMRRIAPSVRTVALNQASGVALMLVAHGQRGHRLALPGSRLGLVPIEAPPDASSTDLARTRDQVKAVLAADTGQAPAIIAHDCSTRRTFDAVDAKAYGLIDEVWLRGESHRYN